MAWENGFQHSGSRWFADREEVTLTEPEDPRRSQVSCPKPTVCVVVSIAVLSHDFADGLNTYTIISLYGNDCRRALTLLIADALAPVIGAASTLLFTIPHQLLGLYLGFFAGVLLYLATADILPEAHAHHPSRLTLVCTVLGVGSKGSPSTPPMSSDSPLIGYRISSLSRYFAMRSSRTS